MMTLVALTFDLCRHSTTHHSAEVYFDISCSFTNSLSCHIKNSCIVYRNNILLFVYISKCPLYVHICKYLLDTLYCKTRV